MLQNLPCSVLRVICTLLDASCLLHCPCSQELTARLKSQTHAPLDAWHIRYGELKVGHVMQQLHASQANAVTLTVLSDPLPLDKSWLLATGGDGAAGGVPQALRAGLR